MILGKMYRVDSICQLFLRSRRPKKVQLAAFHGCFWPSSYTQMEIDILYLELFVPLLVATLICFENKGWQLKANRHHNNTIIYYWIRWPSPRYHSYLVSPQKIVLTKGGGLMVSPECLLECPCYWNMNCYTFDYFYVISMGRSCPKMWCYGAVLSSRSPDLLLFQCLCG